MNGKLLRSELKSIVYVKTGGKRGRPKKNN